MTIFKQWWNLPSGNLGWGFPVWGKCHLKRRRPVCFSHFGTVRHSAGCRRVGAGHSLVLPALPGIAHSQGSLTVPTEPCSLHIKPRGQHWPQALSLSKAGEHRLCTHFMQTASISCQLELENRLRHVHNSCSRQILRHFLKILPPFFWHSCLEFHISGLICKLPCNWGSWSSRRDLQSTVRLLSARIISPPEPELCSAAPGRRHCSPGRAVCRHFRPLSRGVTEEIKSNFPCFLAQNQTSLLKQKWPTILDVLLSMGWKNIPLWNSDHLL